MHKSLFTSTYKANLIIKTEGSNLKGAKQNITDRINEHLYDSFLQCVDPWHVGTNPDPDPRIRLTNSLQDANK